MADRKAEIKFTYVRHADGTEKRESGDEHFRAAERQKEDLGFKKDQTRQTRHGTVEADQPIRGGRPNPLEPVPGTKNLIP